jgi:hypothetical protein
MDELLFPFTEDAVEEPAELPGNIGTHAPSVSAIHTHKSLNNFFIAYSPIVGYFHYSTVAVFFQRFLPV